LRDRQQRRYEWPLRLAKASLLWERLWPRLWPILGIVGTFVAIALLDVLPALPPALHTLVLFVLVAALAVALRNAALGLQPVRRREARHRLEQDSGLSHRPLTALEDDLLAGSGDPAAQAVWSRHVKQMAAAAGRLRVRLPAPGMAGIEPYGLRVIVVLVLIIGLVAAGDHAGARLKRAVTPHLAVPPIAPAAIDVWVTPPAYTGMAPLFLKVPGAAEAEVARVPAGSAVLAQVYGLAAPPRLLVGSEPSDFASLGTAEGGTGYRAEVEIHSGDRLAIRAGRRTLASWPIEVVSDQTPEVQFTALPDATADGLLRVGYEAADDYGIAAVTAVIHHGDDNSDGKEAGVRVSMPLASPGASAVEGQSQHDLTFHQWAGLEVSISLEAEDAAGQIGLSSAVSVVLPERPFSHPVARAVIEQRKRLIDENVATRKSVASRLGALGARPERFAHDVVVSLALAVARSRLLYDENAQAVASVRSILWDTALRIEQGTLPAAEQRLSEARDRLQDALRSDLSGDEIDVLADELQHALNAYLEALATELARQGISGSPPIPMDQSVHGQDLREIVEMARQLARAGARDRARDLLAELQHLLDGVRSSFTAGIQAAEEMAEAGRLLSELEDLTLRQEDLLDSTFGALHRSGTDDAPGRPSPSRPDSEPAVGAVEQNALRRALDDLMGRIDDLLGSVPAPLGEAKHAMGDAAAALRAQHLAAAVSDQTRAVEKLRAAAEASARMVAERLSGAGGMLVIRPGGNPWGSGDPFGRFGTEGLRGLGIGDVEIPDGAQMRYVEEILRELRRRAGDHQRPQLERDYIERLLRRF
jgi:uncharacterized protein (TIGR02302 family)